MADQGAKYIKLLIFGVTASSLISLMLGFVIGYSLSDGKPRLAGAIVSPSQAASQPATGQSASGQLAAPQQSGAMQSTAPAANAAAPILSPTGAQTANAKTAGVPTGSAPATNASAATSTAAGAGAIPPATIAPTAPTAASSEGASSAGASPTTPSQAGAAMTAETMAPMVSMASPPIQTQTPSPTPSPTDPTTASRTPDTAGATSTASATPLVPSRVYRLQFGAFRNAENATSFQQSLAAKGVPATLDTKVDAAGRTWMVVVLDGFPSIADASREAAQLRRSLGLDGIVRPIRAGAAGTS